MRQKYRCDCDARIDAVIGGERPTPGGRHARIFAAKFAPDKNLDGLSAYTTVAHQHMTRRGLGITSQTLLKQLDVFACDLEPTYDALLDECFGPVIGLDQIESRWGHSVFDPRRAGRHRVLTRFPSAPIHHRLFVAS